MQEEPLDAIDDSGEKSARPFRFVRYLRNTEIVALALWLYGYIGMSFFPFGLKAFGAGTLILLVVYLLLPGLLTGARGWRQQLVAYLAGFILCITLIAEFFSFEAWEGATSGFRIAFISSLVLLIACVVYLLSGKKKLQEQSFAYMVLIRMFMVTVFTVSNAGLYSLNL